jgi:hypothetical protein
MGRHPVPTHEFTSLLLFDLVQETSCFRPLGLGKSVHYRFLVEEKAP